MNASLSARSLSEQCSQNVSARESLSDLDLFLSLQTGQSQALGILYNRYAAVVHQFALRVLGSAEDAEDVTQEIFMALKTGGYDYRRSSLKHYLILVARSRALDRLRVRNNRLRILHKNQHESSGETRETIAITPLDYVAKQERAQAVRWALAQLPSHERETLTIAYYDGLSHSQIAARLGIPLGTVKTRSRKGLIHLRQIFEEQGLLPQ